MVRVSSYEDQLLSLKKTMKELKTKCVSVHPERPWRSNFALRL